MTATSHTTSEAMDAETLEALRGSIAKWEGIAAGTEIDQGSENCPLCRLFYESAFCAGCPVMARTGHSDCTGSPYDQWHIANPWPRDEDGNRVYNRPATTDQHREIARAEVDFLKSLLPDALSDDLKTLGNKP